LYSRKRGRRDAHSRGARHGGAGGAAAAGAGSEGGGAPAGAAGGAPRAIRVPTPILKALEIQKWYHAAGRHRRSERDPLHQRAAAPRAQSHRARRQESDDHPRDDVHPQEARPLQKQPLIVFAHQGIHSDFGRDYEYGAVKELVQQGYSVIGPDYRGSTGWGNGFYNQIDYGGLEVEDVYQAREWMLDNYDFLDPKRVGIMGWSHGGFITLMNILLHPGVYAVAYAGVPVTDLVLRLGYHDASYQAIFSAASHVGKPVSGDIQEYLKRSPITYADKLDTPLLIHGNTNDEDVNVIEIQRFVTALKAAGKKFEYKIYENAPGRP
jgi:dienelactone hydrolase